MQYNEFLQKSGLDRQLSDGVTSSAELYKFYTEKINPLYMLSGYLDATTFCKAYRRCGYAKMYNRIKKEILNSTDYYIDPCVNGISLTAFNIMHNVKLHRLYIGYTKARAIKLIKLELFNQLLNEYKL